jgi:hypothetical protein
MKKIILLSLFLLAFLTRTVFKLGPNIELVTTVMLLSASYFGKKESLLLTLTIMVATDLILGNSNIFLFTWSGFLIPAFLAGTIFQSDRTLGLIKIFRGALTGCGSTLFFYFWTNLGVWALDSWGMYSRNTSGLLASYINGLPFLKMQMVSTLMFVPLGFAIFELVHLLVGKGGENYDRICRKYRRINTIQF